MYSEVLLTPDESSNLSEKSTDDIEIEEKEEEENDDDYFESHLKKLDELKRDCLEKKVNKQLLKKSIEYLQVTKYLRKEVGSPLLENDQLKSSISQEERKDIKLLLLKKEKLNKMANKISKENWELERKVIGAKLRLKECVTKRKKLWNRAAKWYVLSSGKFSNLEFLEDSTQDLCESYDDGAELYKGNKFKMKDLTIEIASKSFRIIQLSRVLQNFICFSDTAWACDKNLLEIVLCTGKILGRNLIYPENYKHLRKIIDDVNHKLNSVKI